MNILLNLFLTFAKIGAFTFGGGYAMIPLLDHEVAEKKGWISADELTDITVVAESTPGPIAINCATYTGRKIAGLPGALAATVGMVLPSFFIILLISDLFDDLLRYPAVARAFRGIRVAVGLIIVRAAIKLIGRMLQKPEGRGWNIAFTAVFFTIVFLLNLWDVHISTIYLILTAGLAGLALDAFPRKGGGAE